MLQAHRNVADLLLAQNSRTEADVQAPLRRAHQSSELYTVTRYILAFDMFDVHTLVRPSAVSYSSQV